MPHSEAAESRNGNGPAPARRLAALPGLNPAQSPNIAHANRGIGSRPINRDRRGPVADLLHSG
nr:hypothetical protein X990_5353 [Burkholderia pseudomallei MSHR4868]